MALVAGTTRQGAAGWKKLCLGLVTLPIDYVIGSIVLLFELGGRLFRKISARRAPLVCPCDQSRCSIVIVTWEGKQLLAESLPPLLQALRFHGGDHEVIIVDNGSTDGTQDFVRAQFPQVRVIRSERNLYFGGGNNIGVSQAHNDIVVLLNNDMIVHQDFLGPLLEPFRMPDVFAVGSQVFLADPAKRREETGKTSVAFNGSGLDWRHETILPSDERQEFVPIFWAHGGAAAVDRKKFLWLGGFDRLFDPFYVEDADLCYGAWKVGWRCLLAVRSKVIHKHRSSTSRFGSRFISQIVQRNQYLFFWKHYTDLDKLRAHFAGSFRARMRRAGVPGDGIWLQAIAWLGATKRLPSLLGRRLRRARYIRRADQEVLDLIATPAEYAISSSSIDFARPGANQLGRGWLDYQVTPECNYRCLAGQASIFLRAPASSAVLAVQGFVPEGAVQEPKLTLRCFGQETQVQVRGGQLACQWRVDLLPAGLPVEVELSLGASASSSETQMSLALAVENVGFIEGVKVPSTKIADNRTLVAPRPHTNSGRSGSQLRILMVCPYLPSRGVHGGANMMFNLIRTLSRRHRITVLSFYEDQSELQRAGDLANYCEDIELVRRRQNFQDRNIFGIRPPEIVYEFTNARMADHVSRRLGSGHYDVIQCEFLQTAHFARINPRIPAVLTEHEVLSLAYAKRFYGQSYTTFSKLPTLISWLRVLKYEQQALKRFSAAIVLTKVEAEFLAQLAPSVKVFRKAMGVDCEYFAPARLPQRELAVVFVGNFRHSPNVSAALWLLRDIWPLVRRQIPDAHLYIVGAFPDARMMRFKDVDNVTVTGGVEDVRPYLTRAAVALAPVFEGAGMRTKVLEAWAMEKPVVGTRLAFEGLMEDDGKFGFVADTADQFAEHICVLLQNRTLAEAMGQRARRLVYSEFSWETFASFYEQVYRDILGISGALSGDEKALEAEPITGEKTAREW